MPTKAWARQVVADLWELTPVAPTDMGDAVRATAIRAPVMVTQETQAPELEALEAAVPMGR